MLDLQDMQNGLDRESSSLKDLESQKQTAQERLEEMDQQRAKLEGMLNDVKQKCQEETQMVRELSFQIEIRRRCIKGAKCNMFVAYYNIQKSTETITIMWRKKMLRAHLLKLACWPARNTALKI